MYDYIIRIAIMIIVACCVLLAASTNMHNSQIPIGFSRPTLFCCEKAANW